MHPEWVKISPANRFVTVNFENRIDSFLKMVYHHKVINRVVIKIRWYETFIFHALNTWLCHYSGNIQLESAKHFARSEKVPLKYLKSTNIRGKNNWMNDTSHLAKNHFYPKKFHVVCQRLFSDQTSIMFQKIIHTITFLAFLAKKFLVIS